MNRLPCLIFPAIRRCVLSLGALLLIVHGAPARAQPGADWLALDSLCHAVSPVPVPARDHVLPAATACSGTPEGFQHGSLWLTGDERVVARAGPAPVLMVHATRFDRLLVGFRYADGVVVWRDVHSGNFGGQWRLGGQIAFSAAQRDARLTGIVLRFDRLAATQLLRLRLVPGAEAELQNGALACLTGATLMLLAIGAIYNLGLALAVRRMFPALQGIWSALMAAWGAVWSQLHLFVLPGMAGTLSSQTGTVLALALVMLAALSLLSAIGQRDVPRWLRVAGITLALAIGVLGVPLGLMRDGPIDLLAELVSLLLSVLVIVILLCLTLAWRRGNLAARAFAAAWAVPLLVMCVSGYFDLDDVLWGGGSQMLVLLSGAWQAVWLAVAATWRFALMRRERDTAVAAQAVAHELARRDPLTGLSNRRGFIDRITPLLAAHDARALAKGSENPLALLVLDIDRFKTINDRHGHDVGDAVLTTIARRLERWDGPAQVVGRLGGEEFAILVSGMGQFAAQSFAQSVRQAIAACDHGPAIRPGSVTVSIGMVMACPGDSFATLYRSADAALYQAKRQGRNQVVIAEATAIVPDETQPLVASARA